MIIKLYKILFWLSYTAVLITSLLPILGSLDQVNLGAGAITIRLDHFLHFSTYFLICMYYLFGRWKGLLLFKTYPLLKFIVVTLLLATVSEVVQLWAPSRAFTGIDLISNVAGIILGMVFVGIQDSRRKVQDSRLKT
jgi:VanZ family protein